MVPEMLRRLASFLDGLTQNGFGGGSVLPSLRLSDLNCGTVVAFSGENGYAEYLEGKRLFWGIVLLRLVRQRRRPYP